MTVIALLLAVAAPLDPHSFGNTDVLQPTHAALDLTLDFDQRVMRGSAELTLRYEDRSRAEVLDLDTEGLHVSAVTDPASGRALPFALGPIAPVLGQRLRINLGQPLPERVRIVYTTSPTASALQWLEPRQTTSGRLPFLFTQNEAIHGRSWIPCMDSPGVRMTYEAVIHAPAGMTVVMSAAHVSAEAAQGVFRFRMPQTIPSYLIALAAGEISYKPISARTGVYAEPAVLERAAAEFADAEKMVVAAEALYGPYAWERWDTIVLPPSFPYGGMENPRLTFATPTILAGDKSLVSLAAHELAHSWSGNLVTNATWADFWLNEGVTTYFENRIVESLYGREVAEMEQLLDQQDWRRKLLPLLETQPSDTALYIPSQGRDPDDIPSLVYPKGANFLRTLERRFGRPRFDAFLRGYFGGHAFQSMTTTTFLELLKKDLFQGDDAAWRDARVEEWIYGRGCPDNVVVPVCPRLDVTHRAAADFAKDRSLGAVHKDAWVTSEWLDFLRTLPSPLSAAQLQALDAQAGFSKSGNSEVLFAWLTHVAHSAWEPGYPALESFLTRQGRRKYVAPLYAALQENPKTRELARTIYAKARPSYHPITAATVDGILKK